MPDTENFGSFYMTPESSNGKNFSEDQVMESGNVEIVTIPYSYVQKIPSPSSTVSSHDSDRYEEVDLLPVKQNRPKDTKKQINNMIKKYLAKLIVEKYGLSKRNNNTNKNNRKYENNILSSNLTNNNLKTDPESKFLYTNVLWDLKNKTISKLKQFFNIFTVVKFNNTECNATNWAGTWQGVCLTSAECTQWNGTALGTCASGYGVCCVFRGTCGDSSSMNCSYFKSPNYPDYYPSNGGVITPTTTVGPTIFPTPDPRLYWYYNNKGSGDESSDNSMMSRQSGSDTMSCTFSVFKSNSNVRQFRIDFIDLDLASPTNGTCTNERLVITGQNTNDRIPVICGYNTGQHVYVDVSQLSGPLKLMILSTTGARKRFKLRICQYTDACTSSQSNCLQYYTGVSGVIQSFNYDQASMFNRSTPGYFNNLNYAICIRREAGYCSITYTNVRNSQTNPFQLVNVLPNGQSTVPSGQAGVDVLNCPDDYIIIDGTRLCGDRFNDGSTSTNFSLNAAVTDTSTGPIVINIRTNSNVTGLGFKLYYMQNACT
ncbi:unnamed protein product [Ceutorhynchus assimilis]|uniref:CUB domain-containing protein n=1 Tax=Ceutorhynchus assimilis TaxID=467358 RepID=A0A9N9QH63_9CUCU|nr:unnamed protein product [Ceutorhynchus assimilis]